MDDLPLLSCSQQASFIPFYPQLQGLLFEDPPSGLSKATPCCLSGVTQDCALPRQHHRAHQEATAQAPRWESCPRGREGSDVSPGSSSWTSEGPGPFSAPILRATWLIPSNPELQGRPASGGRGEMDPRLPAAPVQPSGPDAGSSCAFSELSKRTVPGLRGPRHLCL